MSGAIHFRGPHGRRGLVSVRNGGCSGDPEPTGSESVHRKTFVPLLPLACALALALALAACGPEPAAPPTATTPTAPAVPPALSAGPTSYDVAGTVELPEREPQDWEDLHNVFHLSDEIVSGSEPHGEGALKRIADMGVKTIISVDGKAPDVEIAEKLGMRYVHVPIQYSGITAAERMKLAKAFREVEGPVFVHCFHGVHRGPAAAALGRVVRDGVSREQAVAEMRQWCGTSKKYQGLYETVGRADIPDVAETAAYTWDFPASHAFEGFRQAMVEVSRPYDHLKSLAKRNWAVDPEHPDLHAGNEAAKMVEILVATADLDDVSNKPDDFRAWIDESIEYAKGLDQALKNLGAGEGDLEAVTAAFEDVKARCDACHKAYRNE